MRGGPTTEPLTLSDMPALPCHYCGEPGGTKDHIVARAWLPRNVPQWAAQTNKVPCCARCNSLKSHWRSDCTCGICETAWRIMAPFILPKTKHDIPIKPVIEIVRNAS